jgi:hypothetical protein
MKAKFALFLLMKAMKGMETKLQREREGERKCIHVYSEWLHLHCCYFILGKKALDMF